MRALFAARRAALDSVADAGQETLRWLRSPDDWTKQLGAEDYADPDLARVQFAAALLAAQSAGLRTDAAVLARAADILVEEQQADGSWNGGSRDPVGSPTAWSRHLATWQARTFLASVAPAAHAEAIRRADRWLAAKPTRNVHDAAIRLWRRAESEDGRGEGGAAEPGDATVAAAFALLGAGRSAGGGWGPYANAAPEVFDTALVLLALARHEAARVRAPLEEKGGAVTPTEDEGNRGADVAPPRHAEINEWIRAARAYLESTQAADGSWPETTRPPGAESYAQRVSTTAWAVLALLATG